MQESIERLNAQPRAEKPAFNSNLNTWFLLDKVRGEKTLPAFYQGGNSGLIASIDYLLLGTEHAQLIEASPLLIKLNHTQLSESLYKHIQQERSGIFIQAKDDNILPHLQYLFSMQSESDGSVYARYYDPIFWTTLQLTLLEQQQNIWGNLQKVHTLAPESSEQKLSYITWSAPEQNNKKLYTKPENPIQLNQTFQELGEDIRLLYFIHESCTEQNLTIAEEQRLSTLINLKRLISQQITKADHLQQLLSNCINQQNFTLRSEVQALLKSDLPTYQKVAELKAIA